MVSAVRLIAVLGGILLLAAVTQAAPQFTPSATARLHTSGSGQPGAEWNTGGPAVNGAISYDSGTQALSVTAVLDVMNYFDENNVLCETDVGSNCAFNFGPDLDITFDAELASITATALGGDLVGLTVEFTTTGGTDLTITDPDDGDSLQLSGSLLSGTFGGVSTQGLQANVLFDTNTNTAVFDDVNSVGVFGDLSGPLATLFGETQIGLNLGTLSDFSPSLDALAASVASGCPTPTPTGVSCSLAGLADFDAEANAQIFRTASGQFVPEAPTWLMLAGGMSGLLFLGRRRGAAS